MRRRPMFIALLGAVLFLATAVSTVPDCNQGLIVPCDICGGGGPTPTGVDKGFTAQRYYGDGIYGVVETIKGHVNYSDGTKRMFDSLYSWTEIREICDGTMTVDASSFGRPLVSPQTTYTEGGYATGPFDCFLFGQALQFEYGWNWENSSPYVPPNSGYVFTCRILKQPLTGEFDPAWGLCE